MHGKLTLSPTVCLCIFVVVLLSYCLQTEVTMLVQRTYRKPFLLLWVTHSGYTWIMPLHWLALRLLRIPQRPLLRQLSRVLDQQLSSPIRSWRIKAGETEQLAIEEDLKTDDWSRRLGFPVKPALRLLATVTGSITVPALLWYCAVALTLPAELTALYNSAAVWAYVMAVTVVGSERWELRKALAVGMATLGVLVIVYGDASQDAAEGSEETHGLGFGHRFIGGVLALAGAITYAIYELYYSRFIALPAHFAMPAQETSYESIGNGHAHKPDADDGDETLELNTPPIYDSAVPPSVLLAHANFITFAIGALTFCTGWIALPILHFTGIETFALPPDLRTTLWIGLVVLGGVFYNAGFMVLLTQVGPVVASVGNLCTLVLVAIADWLIGAGSPSVPTLIGGALILGAFTSLALDTLR